jgi:spore coat polysaccharide biosynthesis predicted glycosyltransferase SpsG
LKRKFVSFTENSVTSGKGHYMRQTALKQYLSKKDIDLEILTGKLEDISKIKSEINQSIILIDLPGARQSDIDLNALNFETKICFDWSSRQLPDINVVVAKWNDSEFQFKKKIYSGFDYIMTSEDLFDFTPIKKNYCLVTVGGFLDEASLNLVKGQLKFTYSGDTLLVNSGNLTDMKSGKVLMKNLSRQLYTKLFAEAELLITNGGTTLVEGLLLKKDIIVVPKNKYEYSFTRHLIQHYSVLDMWQFANNFPYIEILNNEKIVLDGCGAKRVGEIIRQHVKIHA